MGTISRPLKIYCDNSAALAFSNNNKSSSRLKHIDVKYYVLKEDHLVSIDHISMMIADQRGHCVWMDGNKVNLKVIGGYKGRSLIKQAPLSHNLVSPGMSYHMPYLLARLISFYSMKKARTIILGHILLIIL